MTPKRHLDCAIALLVRDGRILIARRRADDFYGGWWEFPGGKKRPGEGYEEALHREMAEELGIRVRVRGELARVDHEYEDRTVHLVFLRCEPLPGEEPRPLASEEIRWVSFPELSGYEFPAANAAVIRSLLGEG